MVSLKEGLSNSSCQLQVPIFLLTKEEQVSTLDQIRFKFRAVLDVPSCCFNTSPFWDLPSVSNGLTVLEQWWKLNHLGPEHIQNSVSWHSTFSSTVICSTGHSLSFCAEFWRGSTGSVGSYKGATSLGLWPSDWPQNRLLNLHSAERAAAKEHRQSWRKLVLSCTSLTPWLPTVLPSVVAEMAQPNGQLLVPHVLGEQLLK